MPVRGSAQDKSLQCLEISRPTTAAQHFCAHRNGSNRFLKSRSTHRDEYAPKPDVVVRVRGRIVQIRREQAVVRRVVPVAAAKHGAGGPTPHGEALTLAAFYRPQGRESRLRAPAGLGRHGSRGILAAAACARVFESGLDCARARCIRHD